MGGGRKYLRGAFLMLCVSATFGPVLAKTCQQANAGKWTIAIPDALRKYDKKDDRYYVRDFSGMACAPAAGGSRMCIVVQDEDFEAGLARLSGTHIAITRVFKLPSTPKPAAKGKEFDAEAAAWHGGQFYILGSHSRRAKSCKANDHSAQLVRLSLHPGKKKHVYDRSIKLKELSGPAAVLRKYYRRCPGTELPKKAKRGSKPHGANFEGLAVTERHVFLGLRGPVLGGKAHIIRANREPLFGKTGALETRVFRPALFAGGGVRDMATIGAQGGSILILSGKESDATGGAAIHLWDGDGDKAQMLCVLPDPPMGSQDKPEALLVLDRTNREVRVLVLSDGLDGGAPREYIVPFAP
jgi:hypothetical protein